jgi:hypothetical protein
MSSARGLFAAGAGWIDKSGTTMVPPGCVLKS